MATFRRKRSKKYKSRTKSRRNYTNKRHGKKSLIGGGIFSRFSRFPRFPRFTVSNSQVAPTPDQSPTTTLPLAYVLQDKDIEDIEYIDNLISKITDKKNELEKKNTTEDTEDTEDTEALPMYIKAIITTSRKLTEDYYSLTLKIYNLESSEVLFKQKEELLKHHIEMLDLVSKHTLPVNYLKRLANSIAITYYDGLLNLITSVKAGL